MSTLRRLRQPAITALCAVLSLVLRPWSRPPRLAPTVRRILLVRPCCLGDILLTTGAVRAVRLAYPSAPLDYVVSKGAAAGLTNNPHLTAVIDSPRSWRQYVALVRRLRADRYQRAYIFDRAPQWPLLALLSGIPVRAGLDSRYRGVGLTHRVVPTPGAHEADLAAAVMAATGVAVHDRREEYRPTPAGQQRARTELASLGPGRWVIVHPAGGINAGMELLAKRWPVERIAALIERLQATGARVALVGAPSDVAVCQSVAAAISAGQPAPANLAGRFDLDTLAALVERVDLYIGHDSGPTHLAAAVGTPTVAIFGPTDPHVYAPPGEHVHVVWATDVRIDSAIDLRSQRVDETAIQRVSVDAVWKACVAAAPWLAPATATAAERPS